MENKKSISCMKDLNKNKIASYSIKDITQNSQLNNKIKLLAVYSSVHNPTQLSSLVNKIPFSQTLKLADKNKKTARPSSLNFNFNNDLNKNMLNLESYQSFEQIENKGELIHSNDKSSIVISSLFSSLKNKEKKSVSSQIDTLLKDNSSYMLTINDKAGFNNPYNAYAAIRKNKSLENIFNMQNFKKSYELKQLQTEKIEEYYRNLDFKNKHIVENAVIAKKSDSQQEKDKFITNDLNSQTLNSSKNKKASVVIDDSKTLTFKTQPNDLPISIIPNNNNIVNLFAYFYYPSKIFPEGRESASLSYGLANAYLYGGLDSSMKNFIWEFNPKSMTWKKLSTANNSVYYQRHSHTCIIYNNKLYIYGGKSKFNNIIIYPELDIFDIELNSWISHIGSGSIKPRKNHSACNLGNCMVLHGGVSEEGTFLSDTFYFNFDTNKFNPLFVEDMAYAPQRAYHSCAMVAPFEFVYSAKSQLYFFDNSKKKYGYQLGMYIFGGMINSETITNDVMILTLGKKPCEWKKYITSGKPPPARFSSSMNFYEEAQILIIHGGRTINSTDEMSLGDTYILNLVKAEWYLVELSYSSDAYKTVTRFGHCSMLYTDKLIIFGGSNDYNLIGSSFFIINLNKTKVNSLLQYSQFISNNIPLGKLGRDKIDTFNKIKRKISMARSIKLPDIK